MGGDLVEVPLHRLDAATEQHESDAAAEAEGTKDAGRDLVRWSAPPAAGCRTGPNDG